MISARLSEGLVVLLVIATLAALAATPMGSGWVMRPFSCDLGASPDWLATILNVRHLVSFGVLSTLVFVVFRNQPIWMPVLFLVVVTGGVELEEAIFASGHCRLRDMIPDGLAIGIGWVASAVIFRLMRR